MPIHLKSLDVAPDVEGLRSALIVACNMCAGASLAMAEDRPFIQLLKNGLKSPPLEEHIRRMASELGEKGVETKEFEGGVIQKFFLCLWTSRQRSKLRACAEQCGAVIVLGCDSAVKTVRESMRGTDCKVVRGMSVAGIMNTKPRLRLPCDISFDASEIVPICDRHCKRGSQEHWPEN